MAIPPAPPPKKPVNWLAGVTLTAVTGLVSEGVLLFVYVPLGLEGWSKLAGTIGLLAGSVPGWVLRQQVKGFAFAWWAVAAGTLALSMLVVCVLLAKLAIGLVAGVAFIVAVGLLCFGVGALGAMVGLKIAEPKDS